MKKLFAGMILAMVCIAAHAFTIHNDGTGYVSVADVQSVLTPAELSTFGPSSPIGFRQKQVQEYDVTCKSATMREVTNVWHTDYQDSAFSLDYGQQGQWKGYVLTGISASGGYGSVPNVGDPCVTSDSAPGAVTKVGKTNGAGARAGTGFYVVYNATERPLQLTN